MRALLFPDALENMYTGDKCSGYSVEIHNGYYRNYALSCVEKIGLTVDDTTVPEDTIRFSYEGKVYSFEQLKDQYMTYWEVLEPAKLLVELEGGLTQGEHKIKVEMRIRVAYVPMPFTPEAKSLAHSYWVPVYIDEKTYICR